MRAKLNHKDTPPWAIKSVTIDLSIPESLLFQRALYALITDDNAHPIDKELAREVLSDWHDFMDSLIQDKEI